MKPDSPRYVHICDRCRYLGQHDKYDLYACVIGSQIDTLVARYSSDGPDYVSGEYCVLGSSKAAEAIREAFIRANGLGYTFDKNHANSMLRRALLWIQKEGK
jgi:hypothetical protein